jgi:toxin ParE1/3/4
VTPRLSEPAESDLDEIWAAVAEDSIVSADRILDEIWRAIALLVTMPRMGHARDDVPAQLLTWRVRRWLILYEPLDGTIYIARVVHGGRDLSGVVFPRFE